MDRADRIPFLEALADTLELYDNAQPPTEAAANLWWNALARFSLEDVRWAFGQHVGDPRAGQYPPKPSHLISHLQRRVADRWPAAGDMWRLALESCDERNTVVWPEEAARAAASAQPLLDGGNNIGASIAFREEYKRLVEQAVHECRLPEGRVSLGWDRDQRAAVIERAAADGLLPAPAARRYLERLHPDVSMTAMLEAQNVVQHPSAPDDWKDRLKGLREALLQSADPAPPDYEERERRRQAAKAMIENKQKDGAA